MGTADTFLSVSIRHLLEEVSERHAGRPERAHGFMSLGLLFRSLSVYLAQKTDLLVEIMTAIQRGFEEENFCIEATKVRRNPPELL
jgi:hypothetical protein